MLFNPMLFLGHRGEPLGACSNLFTPCGDVPVGSVGEISPPEGGGTEEAVYGWRKRGSSQGVLCLSLAGC